MKIYGGDAQRGCSSLELAASWRAMLEAIPVAAYTCDANGLITYFNPTAAFLWGREVMLRDASQRYCGSYRLYLPDGTPLRHERCWMALALLEGNAQDGREVVVERQDGSRSLGEAHAYPLRDLRGQVIGAVNFIADRTVHKDRRDGALSTSPSATLPYDATKAMIEVAAAILAGMTWPTSTFQ